MYLRSLVLFFFLLSGHTLHAQEVVFLKNPSFEDNPQYAMVPGGWRNCAFNNETPPDIHPVKDGILRVDKEPLDGDTYLGLVVRDNGTAERVGQELETPLVAGRCYTFSLHLAQSKKLVSRSRANGRMVPFDRPAVLRLWGGLSPCGRKVLLAESSPVGHEDWFIYSFQFQLDEDITWICLEAWYEDGTLQAYNGNLLIDRALPFIPLDCITQEPLVALDTLSVPVYQYRKFSPPQNIVSRLFYSTYGGTGFYLDLRMVDRPEDIPALIADNCPNIGFLFASHKLTDELGFGLKEVAVNVMQFRGLELVVGIPDVGKRLVRKRVRTLKRVFRQVGMPKKQYRIEVLPPDGEGEEWMCGQQEVYLMTNE